VRSNAYFSTADQAKKACELLENFKTHGCILKCNYYKPGNNLENISVKITPVSDSNASKKSEKPKETTAYERDLRYIVIDASNVAMTYKTFLKINIFRLSFEAFKIYFKI